ncbi:MAG: peptide deformylase [Candidatus Cloacimonetes bacterium]|jgi:peptide deformylase|nr:peptide deformylase [Candidatus Cloacimonadota bacterium]MDY0298590.1 peptide deformylase [Candidatus Cloacimonadaceae bacterium]MCB5279014.1 peptide deformylase [Candidatus Cloacimonadota bacterium]MCK9332062.1 peptide deformylase [Candidatus Cloacimonadota bacterium]MDD2210596.1 peptide deformylase [Candidatus Cloacimonadota bacterium]
MPKILDIRVIGDDFLRKKLKEAALDDPFLKDYLPDLIHTMYERDGVGLASNQVGVDLRIFVIDPWWGQEDAKRNPRVLINPEITHFEGDQVHEEGCISLPDIYANVNRALKIRYSYTTPEGERVETEAEGFEAVVIQHEYDHLNGIIFTDRVSTLTKLRLKRKLKDLEAQAVNGINIRRYMEE